MNDLQLNLRHELNEVFYFDDENDADGSHKYSNFMRFSPHHRTLWALAERDNEILPEAEAENYLQLSQQTNGWEFDEEIEEIEESLETGRSELLLSHENLFLFLVMIIVVIFMGMLWSYTKKQK